MSTNTAVFLPPRAVSLFSTENRNPRKIRRRKDRPQLLCGSCLSSLQTTPTPIKVKGGLPFTPVRHRKGTYDIDLEGSLPAKEARIKRGKGSVNTPWIFHFPAMERQAQPAFGGGGGWLPRRKTHSK